MWFRNPTGHLPRQNCNSKRYVHAYFHSSTIHHSQNMETSYMFIRWMDKEDVACTHTHTHTHTHTGILLSHKKNKTMSFAAIWMDLETTILSEVRKIKTNTIWYHLYVESKIRHKWTYLWNKNRLIDNKLWMPRGWGWGRDGLGVWG